MAVIVPLGRGPAFAQGGGASSTGSISGEVKDAQGGVLPGVTVTATSPAQIGQLTAVTNEAGIYRFPSVPPGEYRLAFELAGFQTVVRDGIRITLGFNAQVNVHAQRRDAAGDRDGQRRSRRSSTPRRPASRPTTTSRRWRRSRTRATCGRCSRRRRRSR